MQIKVDNIDHVVMTVKDIKQTCEFYQRVLHANIITFKGTRKALLLGQQKINLHQHHNEFEPHALHPTPGSLDLCLITQTPLESVIKHLQQLEISIEEGSVERTGAHGAIISVYIRDPDQNLIEIANYI